MGKKFMSNSSSPKNDESSVSLFLSIPDYTTFSELLHEHEVALTPAEMHGLLTGLIVGNLQTKSWTAVLYDMTNEGIAYPQALRDEIIKLYDFTRKLLEGGEYTFDLYLPKDHEESLESNHSEEAIDEEANLYLRIEALSGWVNHFLLGLGLSQQNLSQLPSEEAELLEDLRDIAKLGFDEDDSASDLEEALIEVSEYVRMAAIVFFDYFAHDESSQKKPIHIPDDLKPTLH